MRTTRLKFDSLEDRCTPATLPTGFAETIAADGLTNATAMEVAPNGDLWVTEQGGGLKRFRPGSATADLVANVSTLGLRSEGERGLLGLAFDPDYASNKHLYLYYTSTADSPTIRNRISRFAVADANPADYSLVDTAANPANLDETVILNLDPLSGATNHNGGAIHFGPDGKLYVAVGENATPSFSQSLANRHGKILRINKDGSIPADNPTTFAGISGTPTGDNRAIWAVGVRNPFTFTIQPGTGRLFVNDVGQGTWEEVNEGGPGRNFGWPATEGDFDQAANPNFTRPFYAYRHGSGTFEGFAITGGAFYNPTTSSFPTEYQGDYFFADYVKNWINVIDPATREVRRFATNSPAVVDLRTDADGSLLYLARGANKVYRVQYTASSAPSISQQPANVTVNTGGTASFTVAANGTGPLNYQWQKLSAGTWGAISGATAATLTIFNAQNTDAGDYRVVVSNSAGSVTSNVAALTVTANQPPTGTVNIDSGLTGGKFVAGQAIAFSGTGADPEDGALGAAAFTWKVEYVSSIASGSPAVRPFVPEFSGATGGTFTPATTGPYTLTDVAYRITLVVRDSGGLTRTYVSDVVPNTSTITLTTAPGGGGLTIDGQPVTAPAAIPSVVGFQRTIGAPATQMLGGFRYTFRGWSDGGAATHAVATPAADATFTATYGFDLNVNFQLGGAPVPAGYLADSGAVFAARGNGFSYGWNAANPTGRDRNNPAALDQRYDTLIHLQKPENPNARWEIAVPNGTYQVRLVAGDPNHFDSVYRTNVEGTLAINGTPTRVNQFFENTVTVTVSDGRLTITNATGARNNKLAFLEIRSVTLGGSGPARFGPAGGGELVGVNPETPKQVSVVPPATPTPRERLARLVELMGVFVGRD